MKKQIDAAVREKLDQIKTNKEEVLDEKTDRCRCQGKTGSD